MEYNQQQEAIKAAKERETLRLRAMQEKMADKQAADRARCRRDAGKMQGRSQA